MDLERNKYLNAAVPIISFNMPCKMRHLVDSITYLGSQGNILTAKFCHEDNLQLKELEMHI